MKPHVEAPPTGSEGAVAGRLLMKDLCGRYTLGSGDTLWSSMSLLKHWQLSRIGLYQTVKPLPVLR